MNGIGGEVRRIQTTSRFGPRRRDGGRGRTARRGWRSAGLALALAGAFGCIERTVTINTEPPGATVFLNDQEIGQSPVKTAFTWYGDYDVVIRKPGYRTLRTNRRIRTPWYQLPGIDIVTENLIPFTIHDDRVLDALTLEAQQYPTDEALLEAADAMRRQAGIPGD